MTDMIPVIMDANFNRIGVIDDYSSFIWATRYYECGDFEICVGITLKSLNLLQKDYYVCRDDDENVAIIEKLQLKRNEDGEEIIIASGRFLSSILGRRIIAVQTTLNDTISNCINTLITQNVISPTIAARQIDNFVLGTYSVSEQIQAQYTGKNLLETIVDICKTYGIGFKVILNDDNQFVFILYEGVNRSYDQTANPYVVFSDQYDNLSSAEYEENYQNIVTDALVAGEEVNNSRLTQWATKDNLTGLSRYEMYDDSRNIQIPEGGMSYEDYYKLLEQEGLEDITPFTSAFTGIVYFDNIKWKEDVNIGDICVVENSIWGISINAQLVEVIESVDEAGVYSIIPTFANVKSTQEESTLVTLIDHKNNNIVTNDGYYIVVGNVTHTMLIDNANNEIITHDGHNIVID